MLADRLRRSRGATGVPRNGLIAEYLMNDGVKQNIVRNTAPAGLSLGAGARYGNPNPDAAKIGNGWLMWAGGGYGALDVNKALPPGDITITLNFRWMSVTASGTPLYFFGDFAANGANATASIALGSYGGNWYIHIANGVTVWSDNSIPLGLSLDTQYELAVRVTGASVQLFINGSLHVSWTSTISRTVSGSLASFGISGQYRGGAFYGTQSRIRIYNRALSNAEIAIIAAEISKVNSSWSATDRGASTLLQRGARIALCWAANSVRGAIGANSGRRMFEYTPTSGGVEVVGVGTVAARLDLYVGYDLNGWGYYAADGQRYNNNAPVNYGAAFTTGDVIGVVVDFTLGTLHFYKNGVSQGLAFSTMAGKTLYPMLGSGSGGAGQYGGILNVGESGFAFPIAGVDTWV